jgi:hypothetical protein
MFFVVWAVIWAVQTSKGMPNVPWHTDCPGKLLAQHLRRTFGRVPWIILNILFTWSYECGCQIRSCLLSRFGCSPHFGTDKQADSAGLGLAALPYTRLDHTFAVPEEQCRTSCCCCCVIVFWKLFSSVLKTADLFSLAIDDGDGEFSSTRGCGLGAIRPTQIQRFFFL